jgi:hypothetical protein
MNWFHFMHEKRKKRNLLLVGFLPGLFHDPEDG